MKRIITWLNSPTTLPKSPPWSVVFAFGALSNLYQGCWWGALFCSAVVVGILLVGRDGER